MLNHVGSVIPNLLINYIMLKICHVTYKMMGNLEKKTFQIPIVNILKPLYLILSYKTVLVCKAYSRICFVCSNGVIPTLHIIKCINLAKLLKF